ncbi:hypothetical protein D3C83_04200 [compost metagenome]
MAEAFQQVGKGCPENQRADQKADRTAQTALIPAGRDLHPHGVNAGEKKTRQKAEEQQAGEMGRNDENAQARQSAEQRARKEDDAG